MHRIQFLILLAGVTAIGASVAAASYAAFAGKNGLLVYQSQVGAHVQLLTVRPDGTGTHQITNWPDSDAINAAWSPNGRRIAYVRSGAGRQRVYILNADGSGVKALNPKLRGTVAWLADGKTLLTELGLRFTLVDVASGRTKDADIPGIPGGSPCELGHSGRIAELVDRSDGRTAIFLGPIGGGPGSLKRLTPWESLGDKIDCSPDGSAVVFSSPNPETPGSANVFTIHVDGTGLRQLTHAHGDIDDGVDSWSPDGHEIAFVSNKTGTFQLYSMNANGTGVKQITHGSADAHLASWGSHP
jgi:TolB protein